MPRRHVPGFPRRKHNHFSAAHAGPDSPDLPPLIRLWMLRILVPMNAHRQFIDEHGFSNDAIASALGLGHWIDPDDGDFKPKEVRKELRQLHASAERELSGELAPVYVRANIARLEPLAGLSAVDARVLEFAVLIRSERLLEDTADWLGYVSSRKVIDVLAILLGITPQEVRSSLGTSGSLTRSGLVSLSRSGYLTLHGKLELISDEFADLIAASEADPVTLLRNMVTPASPAELGLDAYPHVDKIVSVLVPYLRHALASARKGVNVLLYGEPGTGKSQLARAVAGALGCELFEVASADADGDPVHETKRLSAFRAAQHFFARRKALILFDEVDDVFDAGHNIFGMRSRPLEHKAWINRILESNDLPAIWIANSLSGVDSAVVRRFDLVLELPVPPQAERERIIRKVCADLVDDAGAARMAGAEALAPAVVARAASVVRSVHEGNGEMDTAAAVESLIDQTLVAQGHPNLRAASAETLPAYYDPAFVNADADLAELADGVTRSRAARLCFYGPPGTGKTGFGHWLARRLDAPLIVKRASDLMSKYIGDSEKRIARAFREAETARAMLLIDEVDSFLQSRRGLRHSWEVSLVNEMLTQMSAFSGVFIATTNLMDGIDEAALRRFDLKVKFDCLISAQAQELFRRSCEVLGIGEPAPAHLTQVSRIGRLTPGDFATIHRQNQFRPVASAEALIAALAAECAVRGAGRGAIGFVH